MIVTVRRQAIPDVVGVTRIDIDDVAPADGTERSQAVAGNSETVAYVMYTSGSTGLPKGVMVPHRAVSRLVFANGYAVFQADDRVAFAANPAFDASTLEVWAPLLNGGRIVVIDHDILLDPDGFRSTLEDHAVTVLWLTAGLFQQYADPLASIFPRLRYLIVGGDVVDPRVVARVLAVGPPKHFLNGYGPTETTTFAATHRIRSGQPLAASIPIGRPIADTRIYLLDQHGEPVPIGVTGEIHIGGAGVALGYLNRPALTAERFVADPFAAESGARMYKSGDLGRYLPNGDIEFLGRRDSQVKIRGFRVELGEIEARLATHPAVRDVAVIAREQRGEKRLAAYYTAMPGVEDPGADALHRHLAARLPDYMMPAAYIGLDVMPLTENGKIDRSGLPDPDRSALPGDILEAPVGEVETRIAGIWAELLGVTRVGRHDNFFALGGHSLLAVRVMAKIAQHHAVDLPLSALFHSPTVAGFAELLQSREKPPSWYSLVPIQPEGSRPPLFWIEYDLDNELVPNLGADQPIYGFRFGIGSQPGTLLSLPTIEELAEHYVEEALMVQPTGPYFLIGHSWGGLIAYEMARKLRASGREVALVALLDTHLPRHGRQTMRRRLAELLALAPSDFVTKLKNRVKITAQGNEYRPEVFNYNIVSSVTRRYHPQAYSGRVIFFKAMNAASTARNAGESPEQGWERLVGRSLEVEVVPGDHITILRGDNVRRVGALIRAAMDDVLEVDQVSRTAPELAGTLRKYRGRSLLH